MCASVGAEASALMRALRVSAIESVCVSALMSAALVRLDRSNWRHPRPLCQVFFVCTCTSWKSSKEDLMQTFLAASMRALTYVARIAVVA